MSDMGLVQYPCPSAVHCQTLGFSDICGFKWLSPIPSMLPHLLPSTTPKSSGVVGIFCPMCSPSTAPKAVTPPLLQVPCQTSGSLPRIVFLVELCPPKVRWSPNLQCLRLWPYLEIEALQMIKIKSLGWALL